ncbi:MAG: twitching motility protein PilT [Thermoplasmata archaeon]|nr:twitching motility protein PilT [Thermoplasmata archaeon]
MVDVVVLDANALLMPFQFKINIDLELQRLFGCPDVVVPSSVLGELANAVDKNAKVAMSLAKKYRVVETDLRGDDAVLELADRLGAAVVTNDRELISRVRERGLRVVRLRSSRHLELSGGPLP